MRYIADLHIHSKYSRACSKDLELPKIDHWAKIKGIQIVGTADWTHPFWLKHLKQADFDLYVQILAYKFPLLLTDIVSDSLNKYQK